MPVIIKPKNNKQAKTAINKVLSILKKEKKRLTKVKTLTNKLIKKGYNIKSINILDLSKLK